ncbi:pectin lyase fold/virulence factor [Leptodontidium sp. 2 PMI_412]|nr:pectin lyase fold/virulence factor [Leptodontidium sp. 2 PMI_412]
MHYFQAVTVAVLALAQFSTALPSSHKQQKRAISSLLNGSPIGFASATTGGGDADPVYPTTIQELTEYLTSTEPQVVVISGTFDFIGSEGTMTAQACNAYSCTPDNGGQSLLDTVNGCGGDTFEVTLDKAGYQPLWIQSDKTLIGTGGAIIKGKGFRLSGVENIIFQNFAITDLNPQYVSSYLCTE